MKFRMLRHMRLDEHGAALGIKPGGKPVEEYLDRILLYLGRIGIIGPECVPVSDEEKALVLVLHAHPVLQRTNIVAQVQLACGTHAAENAFSWIETRHPCSTHANTPSTGAISFPNRLGAK